VDDTDRASLREEIARSAAIENASRLAQEAIPTSKKCLECGEKTKGKRWCDSDCEMTYQQRKRFNRGI